MCEQTLLLNIYVASECIHKEERETFFTTKGIYLLRHLPQNYITGGGVNSEISRDNCTKDCTSRKASEALVTSLDLVDLWTNTPGRRTYTYYVAINTNLA